MTTPSPNTLHSQYCQLAGLDLRMSMQHVYAWHAWQTNGKFGPEDLVLVFGWIALQKRTRGLTYSTGFDRLIRDLDRFAELLANAKAEARRPKPTSKDKILEASGRPPATQPKPAKTAEQIMRESKLFRELLAREGLDL